MSAVSGNVRREIHRVAVGAATLALLLAVFLFIRAGGQGDGGMRLTARFGDVDGLNVGGAVLLAGLPVGQIAGIDLDPESFDAVVTIKLAEDRFLPIDSRLRALTDGLFGGKYLRIEPGFEEEPMPPDGMFEYTDDSASVQDFLQKLVGDAKDGNGDVR